MASATPTTSNPESSDTAHRSTSERTLVGVDTGGTFTDFVVWRAGRLQHGKVLSTPDDPSRAIVEGLSRLGLAQSEVTIVHGTTVGTNAVLEGKGARVAYVTSEGFADILTLARQNRQAVYQLEQPAQAPPVPASHCLELSTRCDAAGALLIRASDAELEALAERVDSLGVEAVAVNLLFAFLCPGEEQRIARALGAKRFVSLASEVLPELREYERGIATWLNASVGPVIARYLSRLEDAVPTARISVMQSSGTTIAAGHAAQSAVRLLLSGPAGGIAAARLLGRVTGRDRLLTLDMGGTSTDVSLLDGGIPLTHNSRIGGWPLTSPTVDIHTIGAGGGSLARVDAGGMLLVGPESAGADPGPACYGRGGSAVTVTDANLVLGRIPPDTLLGGYLPLDREAANEAVDALARTMGCRRVAAAEGVIRIANEHMARALRVMSVERGHDPRDYTLVCFGGAGGLHACALAELLGMESVLLPALAGVLSAHGMLASEPGREASQAILQSLASVDPEALEQAFEALEQGAREALANDGIDLRSVHCKRRLELRYQGQSATLELPFRQADDASLRVEGFHRTHEAAVGHRLERDVELVNVRISARAPAPLETLAPASLPGQREATERRVFMIDLQQAVPVLERAALSPGAGEEGPCIITDKAATVWVAPGWTYGLDRWGNLLLERKSPP
ncbi:MAG: hydantoinase/oxoprolinase family protein [Pseudomonadota bacterium]